MSTSARFWERIKLRLLPGSPAGRWQSKVDGICRIGKNSHVNASGLEVRDPAGCGVEIGEDCHLGGRFVLERSGVHLRVGDRTFVGGGSVFSLAQGLEIGSDVLISFEVLAFDHDSHSLSFEHRQHDVANWLTLRKDWSQVRRAAIRICDRSWIGARAILLKGITIGEGAVVGAGAVVTRDVPPWCVAAGNPARVIRELAPEERCGASPR